MNRKIFYAFFLLLSVALADPIAVPSLGPRFKQTRERINALFQYRDIPYPSLAYDINLFRSLPDAGFRSSEPTEIIPTEHRGASDETILNQALLILKKGGGGIVIVTGSARLTFNQKIYKEGDYITVAVGNKVSRILISRISGNSVTLVLNESAVVWRF